MVCRTDRQVVSGRPGRSHDGWSRLCPDLNCLVRGAQTRSSTNRVLLGTRKARPPSGPGACAANSVHPLQEEQPEEKKIKVRPANQHSTSEDCE